MGGESGKRSEGRRRHNWRAMSRPARASTPLAAPRWSEGRREGFWDRLLTGTSRNQEVDVTLRHVSSAVRLTLLYRGVRSREIQVG